MNEGEHLFMRKREKDKGIVNLGLPRRPVRWLLSTALRSSIPSFLQAGSRLGHTV